MASRMMKFVKIMDRLDPMLEKMESLLDRFDEHASDREAGHADDHNEIMEAFEKLMELVRVHSQDRSVYRELR